MQGSSNAIVQMPNAVCFSAHDLVFVWCGGVSLGQCFNLCYRRGSHTVVQFGGAITMKLVHIFYDECL